MWIRVLLALAGLCGAIGTHVPSDELQQLGWLAGCWELRRGDRVTLEMWMPPAGNLMLGGSRTVANGVVREYEQTRLEWRDGVLTYTAAPSAQQEATFRGSGQLDSGFTVSNLEHDFPQRISYRRHGIDSLIARIEGPTANGPKAFDFPMRRVRCGGVSN